MWYVIQTQSGNEELVKRSIEAVFPKDIYDGCRILYSTVKKKYLGKWHEEHRNMFPGYIFVITDDVDPVFQYLKRIPAFTRLLNYDNVIMPVSEKEELFLRKLSGDEGIVDMSYGVIEGDQVIINSGPLKGLNTTIQKIDRHKRTARIEIEFLGAVRSVTVGLEIIQRK